MKQEYSIYQSKDQRGESSCEIERHNYETDFICSISKIVVEGLRVSWQERQTVERLIQTILDPYLAGRNNLLEQYLHSQLDILKEGFQRKFDIEGVEVDYSHATHAKFSSIIKRITEQVNGLQEKSKSV